MKWVKIAAITTILVLVTKYLPIVQAKGGELFIMTPLMMLWIGFVGMLAIPDIPGVAWGSKEWRKYTDNPSLLNRKQRIHQVINTIFLAPITVELFAQLRYNQSFLARELPKVWDWLSSMF